MKKSKSVSYKNEPNPQKAVKTNPISYDTHRPSWRFFRARKESDLYIENWSTHSDYAEIVQALSSLENMSWNDIKNNGSHNITVEDLDEKQPKQKLNSAGYDEVFSLRLTGKKRVFGILENGVLDIIWYDKKHQICLSRKKHT